MCKTMLSATLVAMFLVSACERGIPEEGPPGTVEEATKEFAAAVAEETTKVALTSLANPTDVVGEVELRASGEVTRIQVEMTRAGGAGTHQGNVYEGTCDEIGEVEAPLLPLTTNTGGEGVITSTVPQWPEELLSERRVVVYHEAGGNPGRPMVCADITRRVEPVE